MRIVESFANEKKTVWEKETLLIMSNFSFSYSVFKRLVLQTRKHQGLFGKGLNLTTQSQVITSKMKNALENIMEQEGQEGPG